MTDISPYNPDQTPTLYNPDKAPTLMEKGVAKLRQHAELKAMAFDYADFITKTGACPTIFKNKPMDAAAAIIRGTALGFDPDGALEAFFVINGKTGMYARAMVAVAENAGCELWEVEASDESVTWAGRKPGGPEQRVTWTIDRAKKAGYVSNKRYGTNPQEMLRSKCQAELSRMIAAGPLMGLYSETEEAAFTPKPVTATATREDVRAKAETAPVPALTKAQPVEAEEDEDFITDIKETLESFTTSEQVNEFAANLKQSGDVPDEVMDLCRTRWSELEGEK